MCDHELMNKPCCKKGHCGNRWHEPEMKVTNCAPCWVPCACPSCTTCECEPEGEGCAACSCGCTPTPCCCEPCRCEPAPCEACCAPCCS